MAQRGDLIGAAALVASYTPDELLAIAATDDVTQLLLEEILSPDCGIDVYHIEYQTVDPAGNLIPASGRLDGARTIRQPSARARVRSCCMPTAPTPTSAFNMADLESSNNTEALLIAAMFAAEGYIVVAPNYAGYDTSTLGYHPYLNGDQQSKDMIDALTAARSALPTADAPDTTDGGQLLVTGYSQGGYVAMATHRALQDAGRNRHRVRADVGAVCAFGLCRRDLPGTGDGRLAGEPDAAAHELPERVRQHLREHDGRRTSRSTPRTSKRCCRARRRWATSRHQGKLPDDAIFSSTPPDAAYAAMTPATTPANLAPVFALGFGTDHLLTNAFRLAYLQDADANPDGGFPTLTDGLPPADSRAPVSPGAEDQ